MLSVNFFTSASQYRNSTFTTLLKNEFPFRTDNLSVSEGSVEFEIRKGEKDITNETLKVAFV